MAKKKKRIKSSSTFMCDFVPNKAKIGFSSVIFRRTFQEKCTKNDIIHEILVRMICLYNAKEYAMVCLCYFRRHSCYVQIWIACIQDTIQVQIPTFPISENSKRTNNVRWWHIWHSSSSSECTLTTIEIKMNISKVIK